MQLSTSALTAKLSQITLDNSTYDLVLSLKGALGQRFILKNTDTGSDMLTISTTSINACTKPIVGVSASVDVTSAVPLATL